MNNEILVAPSLLSADFSNVRDAVRLVEECGADWLHCDIMDGVFVNNISFGPKMVADVHRISKLTLDAHLMIVNPLKYAEKFVKSGAAFVTVHLETLSDPLSELKAIKSMGTKVGLALKPNTEVEAVMPFLDYLDLLLIMTVEPGFSGQKLIPSCLPKIEVTKGMIDNCGKEIILQVDGGITEENVYAVTEKGANCIVSGNSIFRSINPMQTVKIFKKKANTN
ncbi:MAG: ribulose-phosphate 3-epimerase [Clostridia bacterium]|nr:ribulose-phosphate 3-epimerase [Clostridia bacterium]